MADGKVIRCAIYTRKSTDEGLDQEFNSLDAQREACAAYILSQRHEGWKLVDAAYDDGAFSGGNMERPGLKRLLADIQAGRVDVIVVYKVDRLTRSLADFAKIVDVLDARGASFVSVTQAFNTTTSMGRLTLNVLLSFAQFEREVTGERIRDKIAASKRKGMWMGGPVPLGYDVRERKLVVNETEAELVRHIMRSYLKLQSVKELADALGKEGYLTKVQQRASGPHRGGVAFRRGTLFHLLRNRIYRGEIVHKGIAYPGEHEPIVPLDLWEAVKSKLDARATSGGSDRRSSSSLFVGIIHDGLGRSMTPAQASKSVRRYRYYVTRPHLVTDGDPAWRAPAHDVERIVIACIAEYLGSPHNIQGLLNTSGARVLAIALRDAAATVTRLTSGPSTERNELLRSMINDVRLGENAIYVRCRRATLSGLVGGATEDEGLIEIETSATRVRRGHEVRLIIPGQEVPSVPSPARDVKLISLLSEARAARDLILSMPDHSLNSIGRQTGRCRTRLRQLFTISYLAPDIVQAILDGKQPAKLSSGTLLEVKLPIAWVDQRRLLGVS
ncbi:recombinase family protein [Sphingomonas montanisoli]|uniref:Recombinase family protein n=1 Tax=Sphingomonas montanisoli TaxID=2606412 RepID=A0A5D9C3D4_9SPHN|nr:recombinase family protein [Sphingomonas montanisoli]TZG25973.1 recombinase family protein [Sphingomonas montanisoli]